MSNEMSIVEKVRQAIQESHKLATRDSQHPPYINDAVAAITTFLKVAAEQGWRMCPDEATGAMQGAAMCPMGVSHYPARTYRAMLAAKPKFEWKGR